MKKQVPFFMMMLILIVKSSFVFAQEPSKSLPDTNSAKEVFYIVEEQPVFPGGEKARLQFLADNIKYPEKARSNNIQGTVYSTFIVEKDGSISNVKIILGIGSGCDEEVVRVLKKMPVWKPGVQRGKNVRVKINMPIKFTVE